jgi:hypothetical protein
MVNVVVPQSAVISVTLMTVVEVNVVVLIVRAITPTFVVRFFQRVTILTDVTVRRDNAALTVSAVHRKNAPMGIVEVLGVGYLIVHVPRVSNARVLNVYAISLQRALTAIVEKTVVDSSVPLVPVVRNVLITSVVRRTAMARSVETTVVEVRVVHVPQDRDVSLVSTEKVVSVVLEKMVVAVLLREISVVELRCVVLEVNVPTHVINLLLNIVPLVVEDGPIVGKVISLLLSVVISILRPLRVGRVKFSPSPVINLSAFADKLNHDRINVLGIVASKVELPILRTAELEVLGNDLGLVPEYAVTPVVSPSGVMNVQSGVIVGDLIKNITEQLEVWNDTAVVLVHDTTVTKVRLT